MKAGKPRILFLNLTAFSQTGGIERFNRCFLKALSDLEDEGLATCQSYSAYDTVALPEYFRNESYKGFGKEKVKFSISSLLAARKFDTIILGHINLAAIGRLIKLFYPGKRVWLVTHGIEVWKPLSGIPARMLTVADRILSVSSFTRNKLVEVHNTDKNKITVFPNTIDPYFKLPAAIDRNEEYRNKLGLGADDFVLYTLTRIAGTETYKGYDKVMEAMAKLKSEGMLKIRYVLAGKYDEQEKKRIEQQVQHFNLGDDVQLTGFLDEADLVPFYQMADMYIMPSKKEGFGIVFIEALVCGLPAIGGNADGTVDALQNGETGQLVNPDSVQEIAHAIKQSYEQHARQNMEERMRARTQTLEHYSFTSYKNRLRDIILQA